ncbi:succinate semialdehyde dehydrogenase NADP+ linked [Sporothrix bragantina]|uniref:Succinate semialdehyde dehydrogenase NADP+ linked n=1 Tax=Sporothrix bragantina TaxID=671064 RepID=A0ABP0CGQ5_9PEZI
MASSASSLLRSKLRDPSLLREQAYIGGQWTTNGKTATFSVVNPYNNETIGTCPDLDSSDAAQAVETAHTAFQTFRHTPAKQRARLLENWYNLMREHEQDLATILTYENGRPLEAAKAEIQYAASFFSWFQGEAQRAYSGETIESSAPGSRVLTFKQPVGVVGVLTPWNFPSAMITRKAGAALAAGCSVVVKPAAETPYSALALAELGARAGIPAGVFNVVTTHEHLATVGKMLCEHDLVKKVSFTGSTRVGKLLMEQSSSTLKKLSMELGGNAPFIIYDDADIKLALNGLMAAKFRASGQTCVCANRVYVQDGIYDEFVKQFSDMVQRDMIPGDPATAGTTLGPLINEAAATKVASLVEDAKAGGAEVVLGGDSARSSSDPATFYPATVLKGMKSGMRASREELFGPVVAFYRFTGDEELLKMANDAEVGLAGYVYTEKLGRAWRVAEALETGMVGVNTGMLSDPVAPFGGIKHSGFGREGGRVGLDEFQVMKTITLGGLGLPVNNI